MTTTKPSKPQPPSCVTTTTLGELGGILMKVGNMRKLHIQQVVGLAALVAFVASISLANWFIENVGTQSFPGGPHTIPVGFGYDAPSGVLWIGLALVARDVVQRFLGRWWAVGAILTGAVLSYFIAPSLAWASAVAFCLGELATSPSTHHWSADTCMQQCWRPVWSAQPWIASSSFRSCSTPRCSGRATHSARYT